MNGPDIIGLTGALLAGYAYLPQITHLLRERCAAGISRGAFGLWLVASLLVTVNAVFIGSLVFTFLGLVQISATAVIWHYSGKYQGNYCPSHIPAHK